MKIFKIFMVALLACAFLQARSVEEIKQSGLIKIGVFSDKAPFGYVDENGQYQGYDVYFARRIAKDLGVRVEFTALDPASRVENLARLILS